MRQYKRFALALLLSSGVLLGCEAPLTSLSPQDSSAAAPQAATSTLKAEIALPRHVQSLEGVEVLLEVAYTSWELRERVVAPRRMALDAPTVITGLVPGDVMVTVTARDTATQAIHDRRQASVLLLPGKEAPVAFTLLYGGSTALDLGLSFGGQQVDYRKLRHEDGFDLAFANYNPQDQQLLYWFERDGQRAAVTISINYSSVHRRIGAGQAAYYPTNTWTSIPMHATYIDSHPLGAYSKVRHYQWSNEYLLSDDTWTLVTVDRWYSAADGLLKGVISGGDGVISTLIREGVAQ